MRAFLIVVLVVALSGCPGGGDGGGYVAPGAASATDAHDEAGRTVGDEGPDASGPSPPATDIL